MRRSSEPLWWIPFAGGMMMDAMLAPALIVITGILVPFGLVAPDKLQGFLVHPLVRLVLFVFVAATFFHAAHRLRYAFADLGLKSLKPYLGAIFYGGAIVGSLIALLIAVGVI